MAQSTQEVPQFYVDFDKDPSIRYNIIFTHFQEKLKLMEDYFYHSIPLKYKDFFKGKELIVAEKNPHVYHAMQSLASILGIELQQAIVVNSIVDFSSFCTSIVARTQNNTIVHARNLDFDYPDLMKDLVYIAIYVKGGKIIARAPSIAGYIGAYTGVKEGLFSISYNVRQLREVNGIEENLQKEIDGYMPGAQLIQQVLLEALSFNEAVEILKKTYINTPCYIIVGGINENEGIVITRDREGTNHTSEMSSSNWYVAQTNRDYWNTNDGRYTLTVDSMNKLVSKEGDRSSVTLENIINDVLKVPGVQQFITIFTAGLSAKTNHLSVELIIHKKLSDEQGKDDVQMLS